MINLFAKFGSNGNELVLWSNEKKIEHLILIVAVAMIPIMLIGYPLVRYCQSRKARKQNPP